MIKKILSSSSLLAMSNVIVAIGGVLMISLIAKKLTIEELGLFAVIQTYVLAINSLINFQTWYTVVKYYPFVKNDSDLLNSLLKYSFKLDVITAIIGTIIATVSIYLIGGLLNIPESYYTATQLFSLSILINITGTATGYFRSKDQYKEFVYSDILSTLFKIVGSIVTYYYFPSIEAFLSVLVITYFIKSFYLNFILLNNKLKEILFVNTSILHKKFESLHNYSIVTSITNGFDILFRQGDILVVSVFFGTHYAGIFKMMKTFVGLITQITNPISIVLYPIVSDLINQKKIVELKKLSIKSFYILSGLGVIGFISFILLEDYLMLLLFNSSYLEYTNYLNAYLAIIILSIIFTIIHPIANLIELHTEVMILTIIKLFLFIALVYMLKIEFAFTGFLIAVFIETISTILIKLYMIYKKGSTL